MMPHRPGRIHLHPNRETRMKHGIIQRDGMLPPHDAAGDEGDEDLPTDLYPRMAILRDFGCGIFFLATTHQLS